MVKKLLLFFVLVFGAYPLLAQSKTVTGTVTDATDGSPLPGVNVLVQGTTTGSQTDFDGNYSIEAASGDVLVFSFLGMKTQSVTVGASNTINVSMQEDAEQLGEVVVTALGITKEQRKVGYAVTTVDAENFTKAREVNVANSLAGRVAGVNIKGTSSGPGGTSKIFLRGLSSTSGGSPLFVIDGVPLDNTQRGSAGQWGGADGGDGIGNINPDDIEKMTVLKGQSASALYGSRASNGVILITTKKGKKGSDWEVSYNTNYTVEQGVDFTDFQEEYGQGVGGIKPATAPDARTTARSSWGAKLDGSQVVGFDGNQYTYDVAKNNYLDFYRTGSNFTNTVGVTKGLGDGSFRVSASYLDAKSIVPNSGVKRYNFMFSADQNITDKLNVSAKVTYIDEQTDNRPLLSDGPKNPNNFLFLAPNVDPTIYAPGYDPVTGAETVFSDDIYVTNPYFISNQGVNDFGRKRTISILSTKYNFTDNIYAMVRMGNDVAHDSDFQVDPWGLAYTGDLKGGLGRKGQSETSEFNLEGLLAGSFVITDDFELDALLGTNLRKNRYETVGVGGGRFVLPYLYTPANTETQSRSYGFNEREVQSAYYSLDFSYKKYLTLSTTGRYDTYSTLPAGNRDIFTPSVTGAFTFSDLINSESLSYGKFRASYAVTSGEPADPYLTQVYYNSGNTFNGIPTGSSPTSLPNTLKPFTISEYEFGLDVKFFQNRLAFDISYFDKKTKNEIQNAQYSISSGFSSGVIGNGSVQNKGLEVLVTGVPIQNDDFSWTTSLNLTTLKNEVLKTDLADNPINLGQNRGTLGNAVTSFVVGEAGPQIRAYDYTYDANGNIVVDAAGLPVRGEFKNFGSVLPNLYGGWNNDFNYKGFNLSFLIDYSFGNKVLSATEYYSTWRGLNKTTLVGREGGVTTNGITADAEAYYKALAQNITGTSVVDGDFIKLRQLVLGYSLPSDLFQNTNVLKGVNISLVARNLAILMRNAKNIDPENNFGANINYTGIEGTSLPSTRSIGLNVNFKLQ
ncbi:SusC/RagA family TonB-linked outer membrane protein [Arenibacter palladensis]|uniref:SusC/RagA family TonB-linked outer membrane protein n=1 Tax=Arenibacter palladensis TaxID=237373 RepID=UPI0026E141DA|nr:SusC/RagA family TonB-linked outer membrane protein [Arenibacter palladensis]MDO6602659.1 SusC/RagA family TonB-linked outer membrane protein [Arenibacter palladensis]